MTTATTTTKKSKASKPVNQGPRQFLIKIKALEGGSLLMHRENYKGSKEVSAWQKDPNNASISGEKGSDLNPAWTWLNYVYHDNDMLVMCQDNILSMIRGAAAKIQDPDGKKGKTMKKNVSGVLVDEPSWPFVVGGKLIPWAPLAELYKELDFDVHEEVMECLGFDHLGKRATINRDSKHFRVRPRFFDWSITGTVTVIDPAIDKKMLQSILSQAGIHEGLGDWRPGAPKSPGTFGMFTAEVLDFDHTKDEAPLGGGHLIHSRGLNEDNVKRVRKLDEDRLKAIAAAKQMLEGLV